MDNKVNLKEYPIDRDILVSDDGKTVITRKCGRYRELPQTLNKRGYLRVGIEAKNHQCVHHIVAHTFVPNPDPDNKKYVNHKDGNKMNNRADNLEWVTIGENQKHAYKLGLRTPNYIQKTMRPLRIIETGEIFDGIGPCARAISGNTGHIHECLNGSRHTHRGYHFEYVDEEELFDE